MDKDHRYWELLDYAATVLGGSLSDVAIAMRISRASLWQIRNGHTPVTDRHALLIAGGLGLPVPLIDEYLEGRTSLKAIKDARENTLSYLIATVRALPFEEQLKLIHEVTSPENTG